MTGRPVDPTIAVGENTDATIDAAAGRVAGILNGAVARRGYAAMALAGGGTPRRLYQALSSPPHDTAVPWSRILLFFGDERCVPGDSPDSNQRMVRESLLAGLSPPPRLFPMPADQPDRAAAAASYADLLAREVPAGGDGMPCLDLVLLGVGPDGHTASLFPGTPVLDERRTVAEVYVPRLETWRLSLTLPVLNAARHVMFLVTGAGKAEILGRIIDEGPDRRWPASLVAPPNGRVEWHLDRDAAALLGNGPRGT